MISDDPKTRALLEAAAAKYGYTMEELSMPRRGAAIRRKIVCESEVIKKSASRVLGIACDYRARGVRMPIRPSTSAMLVVLDGVCAGLGVDPSLVKSGCRKQPVSHVRKECAVRFCKMGASKHQIAEILGTRSIGSLGNLIAAARRKGAV